MKKEIFCLLILAITGCMSKRNKQSLLKEDQDPRIADKIVNGEIVDEQTDFMASISYQKQDAMKHFCGGSLVSPNVVVTAAHCVHSFANGKMVGVPLFVTLGTFNVSSISDSSETIKVEKVIIYNNSFDVDDFKDDLALLVLEHTSKKGPISLNESDIIPSPEESVKVMGYGKTADTRANWNEDLREVMIKVVDLATCKERHEHHDFFPSIGPKTICAGNEAMDLKDACSGDSGGPLVSISDRPKLLGVVSWGDGCGAPKKPGIYTRISSYQHWIKEQINFEKPTPREK